MSGFLKFLCLGVFLGLIITGISGAQECSANDIMVSQTKTGGVVRGKQEFQVTLFNACPCPQGNVKITCEGFQSAEEIDPKVLVVAEEVCSLPVGSSIAPFSGYVFRYSWSRKFPLEPFFSEAQC